MRWKICPGLRRTSPVYTHAYVHSRHFKLLTTCLSVSSVSSLLSHTSVRCLQLRPTHKITGTGMESGGTPLHAKPDAPMANQESWLQALQEFVPQPPAFRVCPLGLGSVELLMFAWLVHSSTRPQNHLLIQCLSTPSFPPPHPCPLQ